MRTLRLGLLVVLAALPLHLLRAAEEVSRIEQLREQIADTESLLTQATRTNEKTNLQTRLDRLRRDLEVQENGLRLQERERDLARARVATPQDALAETVRVIGRSVETIDAEKQKIEAELRTMDAQRDTLMAQRGALRGTDDRTQAQLADLDERIFATREGRDALIREHEALEHERRLALEVARVQARLAESPTTGDARFSMLLETRDALERTALQQENEAMILTGLQARHSFAAARLELTRQRLANIDEDITNLERQTGIFNSNRESLRLLNIARSQKKFLDLRLAYNERELAALDRALAAVTRLSDLAVKEAAWLRTVYAKLRSKFVNRLVPPTVIIGLFIAIYFVLSRVVFPRMKHRENLMLMRRFARYVGLLASAVVVGAFLFDDLKWFLAAFTLVSAAIVIALQDVAAAMAGWVVIMTGSKFRVGDRIEIEEDRGDVIDIDLLRTTVLEVSKGLDAEHPTGRVIVVPNSFVLKGKVFNASHGHPYVWTRQVFTFAFESPWREAEALVRRVLEEETAQDFEDARRAAAKMEKRYGVSDAEYAPKVLVRLAEYGYEFSGLHVCHFRKIDEAKTRVHRRLAAELEQFAHLQLAYPTQRELGGEYQLPPIAPKLAETGPAVTAMATLPAGSSATVTVSKVGGSRLKSAGNGAPGLS